MRVGGRDGAACNILIRYRLDRAYDAIEYDRAYDAIEYDRSYDAIEYDRAYDAIEYDRAYDAIEYDRGCFLQYHNIAYDSPWP